MRQRHSLLIENGRLLRRNMRQEMVTGEELMATLRKQGIHGPSEVASTWKPTQKSAFGGGSARSDGETRRESMPPRSP